MPDFRRSDFESETWGRLKRYFEHRLGELRTQNDNCPPEQTERLRGRIAEVKLFLELPSQAPPQETDDAK